jgi:RHS repeat-associated protein
VVENTGRTVQYGYDPLYRLTSESVTGDPNAINGRVDYTLDSVGNRQRRDSTLGPVSNQVSTFNVNDQLGCEQYDLNGNVIQDCQGNVFTWDFENRLLSKNAAVNVFYDGDGQRVAKSVGALLTAFLIDRQNPSGFPQALEERINGTVTTAFCFGRQILAGVPGGLVNYAMVDGQGTVRLQTDGVAHVVGSSTFEAFGVVTSNAGVSFPHGYLGEVTDVDLGLTYLRARYLRSSTGRFMTPDPLSRRMASRYGYADDDPVNKTDRTGLDSLIDVAVTLFLGDFTNAFPATFARSLFASVAEDAQAIAEEDAAYEAINKARQRSDGDVHEYGGQLCWDGKRYRVTEQRGYEERRGDGLVYAFVNIDLVPCRSLGGVTGIWHTHPVKYTSFQAYEPEHFSRPDKNKSLSMGNPFNNGAGGGIGVDSYLGTPAGQFLFLGNGFRNMPTVDDIVLGRTFPAMEPGIFGSNDEPLP